MSSLNNFWMNISFLKKGSHNWAQEFKRRKLCIYSENILNNCLRYNFYHAFFFFQSNKKIILPYFYFTFFLFKFKIFCANISCWFMTWINQQIKTAVTYMTSRKRHFERKLMDGETWTKVTWPLTFSSP